MGYVCRLVSRTYSIDEAAQALRGQAAVRPWRSHFIRASHTTIRRANEGASGHIRRDNFLQTMF